MKKRIVLSSLIFITLLSACQTKQDNEARETKTELLARPEITQAATDGNGTTENSTESSSDIEMAGNYEKIWQYIIIKNCIAKMIDILYTKI